MIIQRMAPLPPDLEVELYRAASGETVKWAGVSAGMVERVQGWALVAGGALIALFNLGPLIIGVMRFGEALSGPAPDWSVLLAAAAGVLFFALGVAVALYGRRHLKNAKRVIWAVTNRRLMRLVADGQSAPQSWTKDQIIKVERLNWDDPQKRGLGVRVKGRNATDPMLFLFGPDDLDVAERALQELED